MTNRVYSNCSEFLRWLHKSERKRSDCQSVCKFPTLLHFPPCSWKAQSVQWLCKRKDGCSLWLVFHSTSTPPHMPSWLPQGNIYLYLYHNLFAQPTYMWILMAPLCCDFAFRTLSVLFDGVIWNPLDIKNCLQQLQYHFQLNQPTRCSKFSSLLLVI